MADLGVAYKQSLTSVTSTNSEELVSELLIELPVDVTKEFVTLCRCDEFVRHFAQGANRGEVDVYAADGS